MAKTGNNYVTPQNQKVWTASINNGDAQAWKILRDAATAAGAGGDGSKVTSITGTSSDSSDRDVQFAIARQYSCTCTNASPGVFTISTGANIANGDQVILEGTAVPTGFTAGTTYFVVSAVPSTQASVAATFSLAATLGGAAINTSSTGTAVVCYVLRIVTTAVCKATAGTVSTVPTTNFFSNAFYAGAPVDNDGNPYEYMESTDFLAASAATTVTSGKMINVKATGSNF